MVSTSHENGKKAPGKAHAIVVAVAIHPGIGSTDGVFETSFLKAPNCSNFGIWKSW